MVTGFSLSYALTQWHPNSNWYTEISGISWGAKISNFGPLCGGSPCTVSRGWFPHRYKPSSLLRPYIANTSALPMLELGSMPEVTTMPWGGDAGTRDWSSITEDQLFQQDSDKSVHPVPSSWPNWSKWSWSLDLKLKSILTCWFLEIKLIHSSKSWYIRDALPQ